MTMPRPNRIIAHRVVKGRDLLPNPGNWRTHSPQQRAATTAVLTSVDGLFPRFLR